MQNNTVSRSKKEPVNAVKRKEQETGKLREIPFLGKQGITVCQTLCKCQIKGLISGTVTVAAFPNQKCRDTSIIISVR